MTSMLKRHYNACRARVAIARERAPNIQARQAASKQAGDFRRSRVPGLAYSVRSADLFAIHDAAYRDR